MNVILWFGIFCLWLGQGGSTENGALCSAALRKLWGSKYLASPAGGFSSCKSQCQLKAPALNCLSLPSCQMLPSLWLFIQVILSMAAGKVPPCFFSSLSNPAWFDSLECLCLFVCLFVVFFYNKIDDLQVCFHICLNCFPNSLSGIII